MKKIWEICKITLSIQEARVNLILCLVSCIGAFAVVKFVPSNSQVFNFILIACSCVSVSTASKFSRYMGAIMNRYNELYSRDK